LDIYFRFWQQIKSIYLKSIYLKKKVQKKESSALKV